MFKTDNQNDLLDVDAIVKREQHELAMNTYATLTAIKGKQFGREIFSSVIKFKDLDKFLTVFPEVQRDLAPRKAAKIKTYIMSGLADSSAMRFFSAVTVTCRGEVFYDETTHRIAIDTKESKLSINDGQHRWAGIREAIRELKGKINNGRDEVGRSQARYWLQELNDMMIPIVIFNQIGEKEEKQLFYDLNNLASRPSRSANIKLVQTDLWSQMARELSEENHYLSAFGVEMDKMSIHKNNPNMILLTTVYACIKQLFWAKYLTDTNFLTKSNYQEYKRVADKTFNEVFMFLPGDVGTRGKYLIEKNYGLKGIFKFIHHCRNDIQIDDKLVQDAISSVDWTYNYKKWGTYGAVLSKNGNLLFSGGEGGIYAIFDCLMDNLKFRSRDLFTESEEVKIG